MKTQNEQQALKLALESIAYQGDRAMDTFYAIVIGLSIGFTLGFMIAALLT